MFSVGCDPSYYGVACKSECSDLCQNKMCNHTSGHCFSCITMRFGDLCNNETIIATAGAFKYRILLVPKSKPRQCLKNDQKNAMISLLCFSVLITRYFL